MKRLRQARKHNSTYMYYWSVLSKKKTYLCQRSYSLQNTKWSQISSHFSSFLRNLQHTLIVNSRISVVLFIPTHSSCPETWILWQSESLRPLNAVHSKLSSSIASIVTGVRSIVDRNFSFKFPLWISPRSYDYPQLGFLLYFQC